MENGYYTFKFLLPVPQSINRADFLAIWQETNPEIGVILTGLDTSLPLHSHGKILLQLQQMADAYLNNEDYNDPLKTFENCLQNFNDNFFESIGEQISWTRKINITVALYLDKELHFVNYGHNQLLLIKHRHIIDIIKTMSINTQIAGKKIFDQIYSGQIEKFYRLALCNQATFDYISRDKLKDIFSLLPIKNIGEQLNHLTQQTKKNQIIAGVILELTKPTETISEPALDSDKPSQKSIENLLATSKQTSKLLRPQLLPDLSKLLGPLRQIGKKATKLKELKETSPTPLYKKFDRAKKSLKDFNNKSGNFIRKIHHQKNSLFEILKNFPHNLKFYLKTFKSKIVSLPKSSRYLLILALILLTLLSINLFSLGLTRHSSNRSVYYESLINQIITYHDEAQATIIYGDNEKARQLLKESINLIYTLPKNDDDRQKKFDELIEANSKLMAEANKLVNISSPLRLVSLNQFDNSFQSQKINLVKDRILVLGLEKIININTANNQINSFGLTEINFNNAQYIMSWDDLAVIYDKNGKIIKYNPTDNSLSLIQTNLSNDGNLIKSAASYSQRLYFLDISGKIWRLDPQGNNFSTPNNWLNSEIDTNLAIDLAIDGNIYLLYQNGLIEKFTRGFKTEFDFERIEPNLTNATRIYTGQDIPYLYILDPTNKRIIVYHNEGRLSRQYHLPSLENLKDFVVDYKAENDKSIVYLLSDDDVYQILIDE